MTEIGSSCGVGNVRKIIFVSSGKGGVGKSTFATQLAISLWKANHNVGLLDIDLCGPSIPRMLGLENSEVKKCDGGWLPVYANANNPDVSAKLVVMSIGFLLANKTDSVVWRGAKKNSMIESLLSQVNWGSLDYLVVDTPPGTSDEKITLATIIKTRYRSQFAGVVLVTTPQMVALSDVRKDISFYEKIELPIIGLVENMSGLSCPSCHNVDRVFSTGGGEALAAARNVAFLGSLPLLPDLADQLDTEQSFRDKFSPATIAPVAQLMAHIARQIGAQSTGEI